MIRLGTFSRPGEDRRFPGLVVGADGDEQVVDVSALAGSTRELLADWDRAVGLLANRVGGSAEPLSALRTHAPVEPGQVLQSGANYRTHVIDLAVAHRGSSDTRTEAQVRTEVAATMDRRAATGTPYLFIGLPSAVTGPQDDVTIPAWTQKLDWELELAAVIGRPAFRVDAADALDHVVAYTIANDLTARDLVFRRDMPEIGTDWFRAKNGPGFTPLGPWLVPAGEVDPGELRLTLRLEGRAMQDESAKDMLFGVGALVAAASQITTLHPGDVVLTGSPAGNGLALGRLLRDGDVMEGTITGAAGPVGFGTQRTRVVAPR